MSAPASAASYYSSHELPSGKFSELMSTCETFEYLMPECNNNMSPRISHSQSAESCDEYSYLQHAHSLEFSDDFSSGDLIFNASRFNSNKVEQQQHQQHQQQHRPQQQQQQPNSLPQTLFHGNGVATINVFSGHHVPELSFLSPHTLPERRHSSPSLFSFEPKPVKEKRVRLGSPTTLTVDTKRRSDEFGNKIVNELTKGMATIQTSSGEENVLHCQELSPDGADSEYGDGSYYSGDESMDEDDDFLPPAPNTRVMDNKPRRGGRHKKDGKPREELLPPPSPRTLNDPDLMQEYRQERNRLAAKRSRERKKDYIKQLESTCKALKNHNDDLSKELLKLKKEVYDLKGKPRKKSIS